MKTDTTSIPLNKLAVWDGNVRKSAGAVTLPELAAHGLLQSLVVRNGKQGEFAVAAGERRLQALQQLAEAGGISSDYAVPCQVVADDADATDISLAEYGVRTGVVMVVRNEKLCQNIRRLCQIVPREGR